MKLTFPFLFLSYANIVGAQETVDDFFSAEIIKADLLLLENKALINRQCARYYVSPKIVTSIIYPELLRYSKFQNFFETKALELLYIESGTSHVDFSIGAFQMKPSFVELLESKLAQSQQSVKYNSIHHFTSNDLKEQRSLRLNRLKEFDWQILYTIAFVDLLYQNNTSPFDQIIRLACLYNCGIETSPSKLKYWENQCSFPYGYQTVNNPFSYVEVAIWHFKNQNNL